MDRAEPLRPLSRDHHVALAVALRLRRCDDASAADAAERFTTFFAEDGRRHFRQEEELLVPEMDAADVERMLADHAAITAAADRLAAGGAPEPEELRALGERLNAHVRYEERDLFPRLEAALPPDRLAAIGAAIDAG